MRNSLKSVGAIVGGILVVFVLSHVTDLVLEKSGWMKIPFNTNPLWVMLAVTFYRNVYVVAGSYVAASLAPKNPMKHVFIFTFIGFLLGTLGTIAMWHEPPHWYPIALVILGVPSALLGGVLKVK